MAPVVPSRVDTCAAEFEAYTPYLYAPTTRHDESEPTDGAKVIILGGGPNRIGQGIEFDYCCVHACFALREPGFETIMVNCNPETVSTDYDTADRLYFEPLTLEDVLNDRRCGGRQPVAGVIVQFGGQTPLNLAQGLGRRPACRSWARRPDAIDLAEDRERFGDLLPSWTSRSPEQRHRPHRSPRRAGHRAASAIPVLVRPSLRAGRPGHGHRVRRATSWSATWQRPSHAAPEAPGAGRPFLEDAYEIDVDAVVRR